MGIQTPLVSIVLATYNGARFLEQQLNSLLAQDFRSFEIIAVDDCSTDCTVALLKEYAGRFSHMKVWTNKKNLGYVKNFENRNFSQNSRSNATGDPILSANFLGYGTFSPDSTVQSTSAIPSSDWRPWKLTLSQKLKTVEKCFLLQNCSA